MGKEAEHTKGPWEKRPWGDKGDFAIAAVGYMPHANVFPRCEKEGNRETAEADAALIAAAPELLEALEDAKQALAHALHRLSDDPEFSTSIALKFAQDKARGAIAKAKGEQA